WLGKGFPNGNAFFSIPSLYSRDWADGVYDPNTGLVKFRHGGWYTNSDFSKRHETLTLYRQFDRDVYQYYDQYNAINVSRVADIPYDFEGVMGVPITFLDKYNPDQFEIIGLDRYVEDNPNYGRRFTL